MCNSFCSSIVSGTTSLVKNAIFPAAFVTVGHLSKIDKYLPSFSLPDEFSFKPKEISQLVQSHLNSTWNSLTLENAKGLGPSLFTKVSQFDSKGFSFETASSTLYKHHIAIGTAAAIGATATILDGIFKRLPVIKHTNPFLRAGFSIGLASGMTIAGAKYALGLEVDPQILMDIAIKVAVIGVLAKTATTTTRVALTGLRGTSDWLSWGFRGVCNAGIGITNLFDWGSLPTRVEGTHKDENVSQSKKPIEPTSPTKAVMDKRRTPVKSASADLTENTSRASSSKHKRTKHHETPSKKVERGGDDLQEHGDDLKESGAPLSPSKITIEKKPETPSKKLHKVENNGDDLQELADDLVESAESSPSKNKSKEKSVNRKLVIPKKAEKSTEISGDEARSSESSSSSENESFETVED